uniref:Uncharacterized protein n=1 Tax=Chromera velia CCMP2878 TaxID=1169474 RepID=A0A0G4IFU2_9ALVE|eukprot:Cvel_2474.t1-p1 / transcript=Cvel_2474.t1 / gene=Cvel_2474 / organism=Chromera_velia_CCMP2878 / gene_product=hypothetical protein / transcript_product=hypothetical protein / location=Cvel_scaffold97:78522-79016(-) / protein_length=81 / sequence_SO=supercontig / SO=protein_coding / is_pseudo=false
MATVGGAFFDSPAVAASFEESGVGLQEFQRGVRLFLHLHPSQILQLYQCFLASTYNMVSSSASPSGATDEGIERGGESKED